MFRCKQFNVAQDKCAMKVNTDSLILGSWVAPNNAQSLLDIGTGTGILALMLAQETVEFAKISALEVDKNAAEQARDNVRASKWPNKITVLHQALDEYEPEVRFDIIVSNPPYFEHANKSTNAYHTQTKSRTVARQTRLLTPLALFQFSASHLKNGGSLYCLYPFQRVEEIKQAAFSCGFSLAAQLTVKHNNESDPYLCAFRFQAHSGDDTSKVQGQEQTLTSRMQAEQELSIRELEGTYTPDFKALCQAFYLNF